ncbi:DNA topoisomerase IB [Aquabacterium sp.]|uniref:DNA topoisomerase IB n=1 Tax=Aquabacterium sp. TaxID=1872578 RepID=UPI003D6CA856
MDKSPECVPSGLVYVSCDMPGIRRVRRGRHFGYRHPDGRWLKDQQALDRIRRLAIPPAYVDVWICPLPEGHLQATGRDARGRKQYRYHPEWRVARDTDKFERMAEFGAALPRIREQVARDLALRVGDKPRRASVLAAVVRLLDTTLIRVGNEEYARTNGSFGLTTLRNQHVVVQGHTLKLRFKGKSGVPHQVKLQDPRVSRIVQRCQSMPGQTLFQYEDEQGVLHAIGSGDVNAYLREACGADFTAKDFRTWHATAHALDLMCQPGGDNTCGRLTPNQILKEVASRLRNTVAVCRKSYVHPGVLAADDESINALTAKGKRQRRAAPGLSSSEQRLMRFLSQGSSPQP